MSTFKPRDRYFGIQNYKTCSPLVYSKLETFPCDNLQMEEMQFWWWSVFKKWPSFDGSLWSSEVNPKLSKLHLFLWFAFKRHSFCTRWKICFTIKRIQRIRIEVMLNALALPIVSGRTYNCTSTKDFHFPKRKPKNIEETSKEVVPGGVGE